MKEKSSRHSDKFQNVQNFYQKKKQNTQPNKVRYLEQKPGIQMQVDPGEMTVQSRYDEKFKEWLKKIVKFDFLIIDEIGYLPIKSLNSNIFSVDK